MANLFVHKDRRVLPNWRSFDNSIILGELDSFQKERKVPILQFTIDDYIIGWKLNKSIIHAAELLSAAVVNNIKDSEYVKEAARFISVNEDKATISQVSLANQVLNKQSESNFSSPKGTIVLNSINEFTNLKPLHEKIRDTKIQISQYPYNPIFYVELSRCYSTLGLKDKAIFAMKTALNLGSSNRFVLRCATRLFARYGELDYAHDLLRKNILTKFDPWLLSAEISIATMRKRSSQFIKRGLELINSHNISPFNFTELASSIATVELLNGSKKKSRQLFNKSLIHPNDNSLAQIEWASQKDKELEINPASYNVILNFEALALDNFYNNQFKLSLENSAKWFIDMPFSKRPIMFASNLASTILKDQTTSIAFLNAGLISHPNDPQIINNLAYALALENRADEAFNQLRKLTLDSEIDKITGICLKATKGLVLFRSGFLEPGRQLYLQAIEEARKTNNVELNWIAILNYAREEIRVSSEYVNQIIEVVNKIPSDCKDIEVKILKEDVLMEYERYRQRINI